MKTKRWAWLMIFVLLVGALPALAQDGAALDATFESEDGSFSFAYPSDWYADKFFIPGLFFVATSESAIEQMTAEEPTYPSGEVMITILSPQATALAFAGEEPATLDEAMALFATANTNMTELGEPEVTAIEEYDALVADMTTPQSEGLAIVIDLGNGQFVLAGVESAPGELGQFEDTVMAILASITYAELGGMVAYESQAGDLSLAYPAGWTALEMVEGNIAIMNEISFDYTLHSGQVVVNIATPANVEWYLREGIGLPDDPTEAMATYWSSVEEKELGEVSDVTAGDFTGTRLDFTTPSEDGYILLLDVDGGALAVQVMAVTGELADFDAEVTAILESMVYTPVEGTEE